MNTVRFELDHVVCTDCLQINANGESETPGAGDLYDSGMDALVTAYGGDVHLVISTEDGVEPHFSDYTCYICETTEAGDRWDATITGFGI